MSRLVQAGVKSGEPLISKPASQCLQQSILRRSFHASTYLKDEQKPSKDEDPVNFRLGLYQSTFDRIQRERADNERFARIRARNDTDRIGFTVSLILRM